MSLTVFPRLPGLQWGTAVTPSFNTSISKSVNGREIRNSFQEDPLWQFELSYEWLPNRKEGRRDLERLVSFFLDRQGSFESFLYLVPETPLEDMTLLGVGDGVRTSFTLLKSHMDGPTEVAGGVATKADIQLYNAAGMVELSGYTLVDNREVVFPSAPSVGENIHAVYTPLYRVRFEDDSLQFSQFMQKLWDLQQLNLQSVFS